MVYSSLSTFSRQDVGRLEATLRMNHLVIMKKIDSKSSATQVKPPSNNGLRLIIGGSGNSLRETLPQDPKVEKKFKSKLAEQLDAMADELDQQIKTLSTF